MKNFQSSEPCLICGKKEQITYHHIYSRGSHPEYTYEKRNMMPLCFKHHEIIHKKGNMHFNEFSRYVEFMLSNGWYICPLKNVWKMDKNFTPDNN